MDQAKLSVSSVLISKGQGFLSLFYGLYSDDPSLIDRLDLMNDKKQILIDKIKSVIIDIIHYSEKETIKNISDYIGKKVGKDYNYFSDVSSEVI